MEEFEQLPGSKFSELKNGRLVEKSPTGDQHNRIGFLLLYDLVQIIVPNQLGQLNLPDMGVVLDQEQHTIRCPDVAFVTAGRLPEITKGFLRLAPDLAVEIISPGDLYTEVVEKVDEYLQAGVRLVWVIDPRRKTVRIYRPAGQAQLTLGLVDELDGEDVIPGFKLPVARLFE